MAADAIEVRSSIIRARGSVVLNGVELISPNVAWTPARTVRASTPPYRATSASTQIDAYLACSRRTRALDRPPWRGSGRGSEP